MIHNGASFSQFFNSIGSVTLTTDLQNCTFLIRVSIPLQMARIGAERITIHNGASFPQFIRVFNSIGTWFLNSSSQNCTSLTRVSIPLQMATSTESYFIEFSNPSGDLTEWVHIAEVRFSDQPITTINATDDQTTREPTTMAPERGDRDSDGHFDGGGRRKEHSTEDLKYDEI